MLSCSSSCSALLQPPAAAAVALAASCQVVGELLTPPTRAGPFQVRMHAFVGQEGRSNLGCRSAASTRPRQAATNIERCGLAGASEVVVSTCAVQQQSADKCTSASSCARASPRLMNGHPTHRRPTRSCTCDPPVSWAAMIGCWPLWGMRRASSRDPPPTGPQRGRKNTQGGGRGEGERLHGRRGGQLSSGAGSGGRPGRPRVCSLGRRRRLSCGVAQ